MDVDAVADLVAQEVFVSTEGALADAVWDHWVKIRPEFAESAEFEAKFKSEFKLGLDRKMKGPIKQEIKQILKSKILPENYPVFREQRWGGPLELVVR